MVLYGVNKNSEAENAKVLRVHDDGYMSRKQSSSPSSGFSLVLDVKNSKYK